MHKFHFLTLHYSLFTSLSPRGGSGWGFPPLLTLLVFLLTSCIDYDDASRLVNVKVQLNAPAEYLPGTAVGEREITMTKTGTSTGALTSTTDANGVAVFEGCMPDVYDISTSWELTGDEYLAATGKPGSANGYMVTASVSEQPLTEAQEQTPVMLQAVIAAKPALIISKIYCSGSRDANNKTYMPGKYIELFNQSDEAMDISGLYIGLLESSSPQIYTLTQLNEVYNGEKVVVKQVFQIPADEPFLLPARSTVLLVNSATDHSDVSDYEYDLRGADFEAKSTDSRHENNDAVKALTLAFSTFSAPLTYMNLMQGGPCGIIIFSTDDDITTWEKTYGYGKTTGTLSYLLIPKDIIRDGVDFLKKNNTSGGADISTKRLYQDIDAGYVNISSASGYTGEVVYRRTVGTTADGGKILMDTNNSSNDFKVSTTIKPREYDEE